MGRKENLFSRRKYGATGVLARLAGRWRGGATGRRSTSNEWFPRRHYDRSKTENRAALRLVERGSGRGGRGGGGGSSTCAQASQESEEGKKRKDRPRGDLRRATEAGARAFVFRIGWEAAVPALALPFGCRPHFQPDRVFRRRRYQGNERGRLCRPAGIALHGGWSAFHFHVPGQSDCQEELRVSRHQNSILRACLSRPH